MTQAKFAGLLLAAGAAGVAAGCSDSGGPNDNRCEAAMAFQNTPGTTPTFSWTPACTVAQLRVAKASNDDEVWSVLAPENTILGPVTYGQVPAGATQTRAPAFLVRDSTYRLVVAIHDPDTNSLFVAGSFNFTAE